MYTLTYESKESYHLTSAEMELLLEQSRTDNRKHGITGCLIYYNGKFIQILEGEEDSVTQLYERIKVDKRHTDIHLFSNDCITRRTFPDWGMAYFPMDRSNISKGELEQFRSNLSLLSDLSEAKHVTARLFWKRIKLHVHQSP